MADDDQAKIEAWNAKVRERMKKLREAAAPPPSKQEKRKAKET